MTRHIKASPEAEAGQVIDSRSVRMHGNKENYVQTDTKGTTIGGPMSLVAGSGQMRFSSLWTMNNEIMLSLPSTMATPTPVMMINPPVRQFASLMKDAAVFIGLLTSFQALG
jgi:hypothetical protein